MITTDPAKAAQIAAAIERANTERWHTRTSGTDSAQAFADRRLLAAELGRALIALAEATK